MNETSGLPALFWAGSTVADTSGNGNNGTEKGTIPNIGMDGLRPVREVWEYMRLSMPSESI